VGQAPVDLAQFASDEEGSSVVLVFEDRKELVVQWLPSCMRGTLSGNGDGLSSCFCGSLLDQTFQTVVVDIVGSPLRYRPLVQCLSKLHCAEWWGMEVCMRGSATIYGEYEREGEHNEIKAGTRTCHTIDAGIEIMRQLPCCTYELLHVEAGEK
jgi:hypothetical protein